MLSFKSTAQITNSQERDASTRNEQEQLRQQQQLQQQQEQLQRKPDVRLGVPERAPAFQLPAELPCFVIDRLELTGLSGLTPLLTPLEFDWLIKKLRDSQEPLLLGQCIGAKGVAWTVEHAQKILIERGFVTTRIFAADQDLSQGVLVLTLVPGRIREIRLRSANHPRASLRAAMPMRNGDLLNLRDIEQALENLKRVPTADADIQIEPAVGADAQPGQSDLVVTYRQKFPLRLLLSADDSGTKATGKNQGSMTLSLDNPLGLNDLFYVTRSNDFGGGDKGPRGNQSQTSHYSLPFGYWSVGGTASTSSFYQSVAGLNQPYVYRGTSENNEIRLGRLLMRDDKQKLGLTLIAFQRKSNNFIDDTEIGVQRRVVGGWAGTLNHRAFIQNATLESNLTYRRGTGDFGTIPAPEELSNEGTSRFRLISADAQLALPLKIGGQSLRYNATWRAQHHLTPLTPQDRFAIGGRFTVRGFDGESVLSAESGWLWRNDLNFAYGNSGQSFYLGLDSAQVSGPSSESLVGSRLTGAVLGLRGLFKNLSYDIFFSAPVFKPDNFRTASGTAGISLSLSF